MKGASVFVLVATLAACDAKPAPTAVPSASATQTPGSAAKVQAATSASTGTGNTAPRSSSRAECPAGMVRVPGGKFWVGSEPDEHFAPDESPRFLTDLPDFCLDQTEVTTSDYVKCVERGACLAPEQQGRLCNFGQSERAEHPINCVTWTAADTYCKAEARRLPSELELEYAARGGDRYLKYPWGDASPDGHACWKRGETCPVKSFAPGAFGLYDVSGNVWEWSLEWYAAYPWPPESGYSRVYRGGGFSRRFEKWMHTRLRNRLAPNKSGAHLGFRCGLTLGPCPLGEEEPGVCRRVVLDRSCPQGKTFNGARCTAPGEPRCIEGWHEQPGRGCEADVPEELRPEDVEASVRSVTRTRSAEFDADCRQNSRDRPHAFRYVGGTHAARTLVGKRAGCKNRDVGVGWNSACCP